MELTQDRVQWRALVLAVLNLGVLAPQTVHLITKFATSTHRHGGPKSGRKHDYNATDINKIMYEGVDRIHLVQDRVQ
jgi:hypothetical protein